MNFGTILSVVQVVLGLLQGVSVAAKKNGLVEIEQIASNAIAELQKVHGTAVTKEQLEGLSVDAQWGEDAPK